MKLSCPLSHRKRFGLKTFLSHPSSPFWWERSFGRNDPWQGKCPGTQSRNKLSHYKLGCLVWVEGRHTVCLIYAPLPRIRVHRQSEQPLRRLWRLFRFRSVDYSCQLFRCFGWQGRAPSPSSTGCSFFETPDCRDNLTSETGITDTLKGVQRIGEACRQKYGHSY